MGRRHQSCFNKRNIRHLLYAYIGLLLMATVLACATSTSSTTPGMRSDNAGVPAGKFQPMSPQPAVNDIAPGLSVTYFRSFKARHLDFLPRGDFARDIGRSGEPIPFLNHAFGKDVVFGSGEKRYIGMRLQGLIRFPQSGKVDVKAFVNDGIRLYIDDKLVIDEPEWKKEGDRFTSTESIDVARGFWYPLTIDYFQRKGTATLKVLWKLPHMENFAPIPAEAYAHIQTATGSK